MTSKANEAIQLAAEVKRVALSITRAAAKLFQVQLLM
jgi:hypothetical protein